MIPTPEQIRQLEAEIERIGNYQCGHCGYYCTGKTVFCTKRRSYEEAVEQLYKKLKEG